MHVLFSLLNFYGATATTAAAFVYNRTGASEGKQWSGIERPIFYDTGTELPGAAVAAENTRSSCSGSLCVSPAARRKQPHLPIDTSPLAAGVDLAVGGIRIGLLLLSPIKRAASCERPALTNGD